MEVNDLFKNINSWRDESQRQLSIIVDSHANSINEAIKNVVKEVSEIKSQRSQLSAIVKERDDLQETVNNLNAYIEHLSAKVRQPELVGTQHNTQDEDSIDSSQNTGEHSEERPNNSNVINDLQDPVDVKYMTEVSDDQQDHADIESLTERPAQEQNKLRFSILDLITGFICNDCDFESSTSEALEIHLKNAHIKPEPSEPVLSKESILFKCEECTYSARLKQSLTKYMRVIAMIQREKGRGKKQGGRRQERR